MSTHTKDTDHKPSMKLSKPSEKHNVSIVYA